MGACSSLFCVFVAALVVLTLASCGLKREPAPDVSYYVLDYESPELSQQARLPVVIRVSGFGAAPGLRSTDMLYSDGDYIQDAYYYYKWRATPGDMAGYFLARDMERSSWYLAAMVQQAGVRASYAVEGRVDNFYEKDSATGWKAVLGVTLTLLKEREPDISKRVLFQKSYASEQTVGQRNPQGVAGAMSQAMKDISGRAQQEIYEAIRGNLAAADRKAGRTRILRKEEERVDDLHYDIHKAIEEIP